MILLLGAAVFVAAAGALVFALRDESEPALASEGDGELQSVVHHDAVLELSVFKRVLEPALEWMSGVAAKFSPAGRTDELKRRTAMAGLTAKWPISRVLFTKMISGIFGGLIGVFVIVRDPKLSSVGAGLAIGALGWMWIDIYLDKKAAARQQIIQNNLPDILDQLTITVEAGLGFEQSFQRVAESNDSPLANEFSQALRSIRLGMPRAEALKQMLERTDVIDLRMFVRAVNQADKSGIPIGTVFRVQADEAREKRRQRAEEKAMALPVKLLVPLVLFILPCLFMIILGPAVITWMEQGGLSGGK